MWLFNNDNNKLVNRQLQISAEQSSWAFFRFKTCRFLRYLGAILVLYNMMVIYFLFFCMFLTSVAPWDWQYHFQEYWSMFLCVHLSIFYLIKFVASFLVVILELNQNKSQKALVERQSEALDKSLSFKVNLKTPWANCTHLEYLTHLTKDL